MSELKWHRIVEEYSESGLARAGLAALADGLAADDFGGRSGTCGCPRAGPLGGCGAQVASTTSSGCGGAPSRLRAHTMIATATMMITPAKSVRGVMGSPRINAPSATATIGLTYA